MAGNECCLVVPDGVYRGLFPWLIEGSWALGALETEGWALEDDETPEAVLVVLSGPMR